MAPPSAERAATRAAPARRRVARLAATLVLGVLVGCRPGDTQRAAPPPLAPLATATVAVAGPGAGPAWDGVVEAVRQATLSAQTSGRVVAITADIDDRVAADAIVLRITAVEQDAAARTARAQLRAAAAAATEAEATHRRYAALAAGRYVSRAQLDQARAARDSASAARDAAAAQLAQAAQLAGYTTIRAPFAGIVSRRDVEPGETVAPGQPLMALYAPGALRIEVQVPQSQAAAIRADARAVIALADGATVEAASVTVFPAADAASHSVGVRVGLPALALPPAPGTTAKVVFPGAAGGGPRPVTVPASALVQRGEVSAVYVLRDGRVALRQVRAGERRGDRVDIVSGLRAGEVVATDPVAALAALVAQRRATAAG